MRLLVIIIQMIVWSRPYIIEVGGGGAGGEWVRVLAWTGDRTVPAGFESHSFRNFSAYPALPVSFGGDTKSCRSLLSGVYATGSKTSHQSAPVLVSIDSSGVSRGVFWLPGNPPGRDFFYIIRWVTPLLALNFTSHLNLRLLEPPPPRDQLAQY